MTGLVVIAVNSGGWVKKRYSPCDAKKECTKPSAAAATARWDKTLTDSLLSCRRSMRTSPRLRDCR